MLDEMTPKFPELRSNIERFVSDKQNFDVAWSSMLLFHYESARLTSVIAEKKGAKKEGVIEMKPFDHAYTV